MTRRALALAAAVAILVALTVALVENGRGAAADYRAPMRECVTRGWCDPTNLERNRP